MGGSDACDQARRNSPPLGAALQGPESAAGVAGMGDRGHQAMQGDVAGGHCHAHHDAPRHQGYQIVAPCLRQQRHDEQHLAGRQRPEQVIPSQTTRHRESTKQIDQMRQAKQQARCGRGQIHQTVFRIRHEVRKRDHRGKDERELKAVQKA